MTYVFSEPPTEPTYRHAEAFCLMTYRADDGSEEEVVWNSRDGVTPFMITLRSGKIATHVDWRHDRCEPAFQPQPGMRIFVDHTEDTIRASALGMARRMFVAPDASATGVRTRFETPEALAEAIVRETLATPGMPNLVEVTE